MSIVFISKLFQVVQEQKINLFPNLVGLFYLLNYLWLHKLTLKWVIRYLVSTQWHFCVFVKCVRSFRNLFSIVDIQNDCYREILLTYVENTIDQAIDSFCTWGVTAAYLHHTGCVDISVLPIVTFVCFVCVMGWLEGQASDSWS